MAVLEFALVATLLAKGGEILGEEAAKSVAKTLGGKALAQGQAWLAARVALPDNADVEKALHTAHMLAWQHLLIEWDKSEEGEKNASVNADQGILFDHAREWTKGSKPNNDGHCGYAGVQSSALSGALANANHPDAVLSATNARAALEAAAWGEFCESLPTHYQDRPLIIPTAFEEAFRGNVAGAVGWHDRFLAFATAALKSDKNFLALFTVQKLATIEATTTRTESKLETTNELVNTTSKEILAAIANISREKGIPPNSLRDVLTTLGDQDVPDEEIVSRLQRFADQYLEMKKQFAIQSDGQQQAQVAAARKRAGKLFEAGDLEGAQHVFAEAASTLRQQSEATARERAALLGEEAKILTLRLRYREAAQRYAEAAQLVAFNEASHASWLAEEARILYLQGLEFGDNAALFDSIERRKQLLNTQTRERAPLAWAGTQNNLGTALQTLGERKGDENLLAKAVTAYRDALQEYTRERAPLYWAGTQNNLGNALQTLGEWKGDETLLAKAVTAYRAALQERTRERAPLDWATTQNNLGTALRTLGERKGDEILLDRAVTAYRDASQVHTRERAPLAWAMAQNNLGNALRALGERKGDEILLTEAVTAYRDALQEYTRERAPLRWAATQNNLGSALGTIGVRKGDENLLAEAVAAYRGALQERARERAPLAWATTQNNLGNVLGTLGERKADETLLAEAVVAYRDALQEYTRERAPLDWAMTQSNLANALCSLFEKSADRELLDAALGRTDSAIEVFAVLAPGQLEKAKQVRARILALQGGG